MTIEKTIVYLIFLSAALITYIVLKLKKAINSLCLFAAVCILVFMMYVVSFFPLEFHSYRYEPFLSSWLPIKNILDSHRIFYTDEEGSRIAITEYSNQLFRYLIIDFSSMLFLCGWAELFEKKRKFIFIITAAVESLILLRCFIVSEGACYSAGFDTIEFAAAAFGGISGIICGKGLLKYNEQRFHRSNGTL